jgi:hypothetical protein
MKRPKSVLWDVCYIRLFLIVLLIAFHAFYHTPLPLVVPADAVPWLGFALTLLCSLLITHFALKSRVGRFLLG